MFLKISATKIKVVVKKLDQILTACKNYAYFENFILSQIG